MSLLMANTFNWPLTIALSIESYGLSSRELFAKASLPHPSSSDYSHQIEAEELEAFFQQLIAETGDRDFCLRTGSFLSLQMLDAFGLALFSSKNLEEAISIINSMHGYVFEGLQLRLYTENDEVVLQGEPNKRFNLLLCAQFTLACIKKLIQLLTYPEFKFKYIVLNFNLNSEQKAYFERLFDCEVFFEKGDTFSIVGSQEKFLSHRDSSSELAQFNQKLFFERIDNTLKNNVELSVKSVLLEHLSRGELSKEFVADKLKINPRTLQYRLKKRGTSFKEVLAKTRLELAETYLKQQKGVSEIAHLLGYTDTSNFCRAFKNWTGKSPKDYAICEGID